MTRGRANANAKAKSAGWIRSKFDFGTPQPVPPSRRSKKHSKNASANFARNMSTFYLLSSRNSLLRVQRGSWGKKWQVVTTPSVSATPASAPQSIWTPRTWGKAVVDPSELQHWGYKPPEPPKTPPPNKKGGAAAPEGPHGPDVNVTLASATGEVDALKLSVTENQNLHGVNVTEAASGTLGLSGTAMASVTRDGVSVGVSGSAGATATGSVTGSYGIASGSATGTLFGGVQGGANANIGLTGVHAGIDGFAGLKATGTLGVDVGGVGVQTTGQAWAGVGATADVDVGYKDGKFTVGGDFGLGLGVGGMLGTSVTVNVPELVNTFHTYGGNIASAGGNLANAGGNFAHGAQDTGGAFAGKAGNAVHGFANGLGDAGHGFANGLGDAGHNALSFVGL